MKLLFNFLQLDQNVSRFFRTPLAISLNEQAYCYKCPADFDFALRARAANPATRVQSMFLLDQEQREHEINALSNLDDALSETLADAKANQAPLKSALRQIGTMVITKDNDWREIFDQLLAVDLSDETYLEVALKHYFEYIQQRREIIGAISLMRSQCRDQRMSTCLEQSANASEVATAAIMVEARSPATEIQQLARLPQGQAVLLTLNKGREVTIKLAKHSFSLARDNAWRFVAKHGQIHTLSAGPNSVGRSKLNHISIDSQLKNISRKHLIAEPVSDDVIRLTDISSCGTWIPRNALASAS